MQKNPYGQIYKGDNHTFRMFKDEGDDQGSVPWNQKIFQNDESHKCPTYVSQTPPCQGSCPSGHNVRGWLDIVRGIEKPSGDLSWQEYAFRRSTDANPFPSVMGRVCPAPCEDGCNRNEVEDTVGINAVEQFIGDTAKEKGYKFEFDAKDTGKKVAIIGGGCGGLTAALQLRKQGHSVTVFEKYDQLGGMMMYGIPDYRVPRDVLKHEIDRIIETGVETKMNTKVGVDVSMEKLEKDYDAVLFAIGAMSGRSLPIPGGEAGNCVSGVAFLEAYNQGRLKHITGKVICIGGGDTSIDVVSVARRLGNIENIAEKDRPERVIFDDTAHDVVDTSKRLGADVLLTTRSTIENMPAAQEEIDDANREGVEIQGQLQPVEVVTDNDGRAVALRMVRLEEDGSTPIEGSEFDIECELIVSAIGQGVDAEGMDDSFFNERGFIDADKNFQVPNKPGFFVCGDVVRPHLLTTAIGQAGIAADSIDDYLAGNSQKARSKVDVHYFDLMDKLNEWDLSPTEYEKGAFGEATDSAEYAVHNYEDRSFASIIPHTELFLGHFDNEERNARNHKTVDVDNVLGNFEERLIGYSEEEAKAESGRCMSCGLCFECDNCVMYCPQDAVFKVKKDQATLGRYVDTDYNKCIGCHICADVCPTGYIQMGLGE
ncbi:Protein similar to glutamate synthase [NADPH] small chain, clustered with sulfite reductase [uncultured Gammaproteobacteria bacterium]|jgi:NADPH-dependent glutamate synthase beta subunit-like oxidoreductase|uniref:NAD(P)-binding protein n=1 Tax=thiotrophic endosymbiont of Bathymodiolus puteoserpentis (Logatchev) TaxID=343240 RepID=UPI0010B2E7D3|nr:NAD(P)-binding protein [thiotrophic endosymbiont of Bathymodiolus puteoserpentis (Logatchev)]CAC9493332.1 Protein similar to glutamate synthase [NADPH] small chain, clustered with sulfite reductase [uncultured Gammaproteobacteria bacterium]CAC9588760.1 Protein similar to glutamate synthase [NADPH] small chain, clustered with sulfite reductase [uncultured Gammaproteobacteria bacterium]CAC9588860.1 Protein similar to glutamate synthase [NADPH] small chain, clustered with sulfite reductase [uncu